MSGGPGNVSASSLFSFWKKHGHKSSLQEYSMCRQVSNCYNWVGHDFVMPITGARNGVWRATCACNSWGNTALFGGDRTETARDRTF